MSHGGNADPTGIQVTFLDQTGAKSVKAVIAFSVPVSRILPNIITKMNLPVTSPDGQAMSYSLDHKEGGKRLVEVFDDIADMFDADAEPNHFRPDAGFGLLLCRHLPMRRRGGVAGERFGIADVDQSLDQAQRVIEVLAGLHPTLDAEGHQRCRLAGQILLGHGV